MVKKGYELTNCALHINMDGNSINMDNNYFLWSRDKNDKCGHKMYVRWVYWWNTRLKCIHYYSMYWIQNCYFLLLSEYGMYAITCAVLRTPHSQRQKILIVIHKWTHLCAMYSYSTSYKDYTHYFVWNHTMCCWLVVRRIFAPHLLETTCLIAHFFCTFSFQLHYKMIQFFETL